MELVTCAEEDRIGNLPEHLIDSVLERVLVKDAVRTSVLSKKWRYRWTTMRVLVFNKQFSEKFAKNGAFGSNGFIRIINQVLFFHKGPVLKFHLHIPPNIYLDSFQEVDQWMMLLSRNGVRELILTNSNQCYKLPCYVFSCLELKTLIVENCFFKPPFEFEGFLNLEGLDLRKIEFGAHLSGTQISLPQLKKLFLYMCINVYHFNIKATKLQSLFFFSCPDALLLRLLHSPCLTQVVMCFYEPIEENLRVEKLTMAMMLSNLPIIEHLYVDSLFFKVLIAEKIPKWLPRATNSLKRLSLLDFELGDLYQLEVALCLLRNSPNLESFYVVSLETESGVINLYDVRPASDHLEAPDCLGLDCTLNQLQTVEITDLEGSRPELLFIKLLLAHSPSLEELSITPSVTCDAKTILNIAKDVMRFPRASPKAQVIYLNPKP